MNQVATTTLEPICESCGGQEWRSIKGTSGGNYIYCRHCRHHIRYVETVSHRATRFEEEQQKYYGDDSFCATQLFAELQEQRVVRRIEVVQRYLPQGHLLEVGPGSGEVLSRFARLGYKVTGVEHSATMSELIRERHGLDIRVGTFEENAFDPDSSDAYLSFHVIEHVTDVSAHLAKAADVVRSGGYAFLATPNADSWEHRVSGALSPNYSPVHLQLFSKSSMTRLLDQAGFEVVNVITPCYTDAWMRVASSFVRGRRGRPKTAGKMVQQSDTPLRRNLIHALGILQLPVTTVQEAMRGGNELFVVAKRR
ncbi:MAG: hypothetical protein CMJ80_06125 [Planctomycetaceae bacterium]|nr:hypothetical protein [Planctomycetaceae bacterium]